nr:MAG TPA: hypothetical protein [Bacteriophage sp.]
MPQEYFNHVNTTNNISCHSSCINSRNNDAVDYVYVVNWNPSTKDRFRNIEPIDTIPRHVDSTIHS